MRTALVLALALLAIGTLMPVAAAEPNGFGRCWIDETGYTVAVIDPDGNIVYETSVPYVACAW